MHDKYIVKKDFLKSFLRKICKSYRLVAPVKNRHGDTRFTIIDDIDACEIELNEQPQNSLKQFFFPQQEKIYSYKTDPGRYTFSKLNKRVPPTVYFGVRSCDLSAVLYMDVVFSKNGRDPFYLEKRQESVIIGFDCNTPFENCFCNATRSGPYLEFGADLQMTDLGESFYVVTGRASGDGFVAQWPHFFEPATEEDTKKQYQSFLEARGNFKRQVHVDQAMKRLQDEILPDDIFTELSLRCQDCGGCAFICPTCTCFTLTDFPLSAQEGIRLRSWDACTFAGFTRMAGGHNPVNQKKGAIRQRFLHKLKYDVQQHGRPSCVGCGRCVGICFGGTDIVRFIDHVCEGVC